MSGVHDRPRQLLIRTELEEGDCVRLTVQDVGVGFDPQAMHSSAPGHQTRPTDTKVSDEFAPGWCMLPQWRVMSLQRELRRLRLQMPIVFITANADETLRPRLLEQGAVACLLKPFSETALRQALDAALGVS